MAEENVFVDGLRTWHPHENAPDFVKFEQEVTDIDELYRWMKQHATQRENGKMGLRWTIKMAKSTGNPYASLNTFKPKPQGQKVEAKAEASPQEKDDDLPF